MASPWSLAFHLPTVSFLGGSHVSVCCQGQWFPSVHQSSAQLLGCVRDTEATFFSPVRGAVSVNAPICVRSVCALRMAGQSSCGVVPSPHAKEGLRGLQRSKCLPSLSPKKGR